MVGWLRRRGGLVLALFVVTVQIVVLSVVVAPTADAATSPPQSMGTIQLDANNSWLSTLPDPNWSLLDGLPVLGEGASDVGLAGGASEAAAAGGVCATGVGCAVLAGVAVAGLAYATKDVWLPWVSQSLGVHPPKQTPDAGDPAQYLSFSSGLTGVYASSPTVSDFSWQILSTGVHGCSDVSSNPCQYSGWAYYFVAYTEDTSGVVHEDTGWDDYGECHDSGAADYLCAARKIGPTSSGLTQQSAPPSSTDRVLYFRATPTLQVDLGVYACQPGGAGAAYANCPDSIDKTYELGKVPPASAMQFQVSQVCWSADLGAQTGVSTDPTDGMQGVSVPACPAGQVRESTKIQARATPESPWQTVAGLDWTSAGAPSLAGSPAGFPECYDSTGHLWSYDSPQACGLEVHLDGQKCIAGSVRCADWAEIAQSNPAEVTCYWGPYEVPVTECYVLERAYQWTAVPVTAPNIDGDPSTSTPPEVAPAPSPSPSPSSSASPSTAPSTAPSGDPSPAPTSGPVPGPVPPGMTPEDGACWPSGWGAFNPASWVLDPIKCALQWAFVPKADLMSADAGEINGDLTNVGLGPIITQVGTAVSSLGGGGGGCQGPPVEFDVPPVDKTLYPFSACSSPMSTVASLVYALTTVTVGVAGALAVLRAFGIGFSFEFGMKGGGEEA